eukprot:COSAG02_NODE_3978_length_5960_cov_5.861116_3_plen_51_part_00
MYAKFFLRIDYRTFTINCNHPALSNGDFCRVLNLSKLLLKDLAILQGYSI